MKITKEDNGTKKVLKITDIRGYDYSLDSYIELREELKGIKNNTNMEIYFHSTFIPSSIIGLLYLEKHMNDKTFTLYVTDEVYRLLEALNLISAFNTQRL